MRKFFPLPGIVVSLATLGSISSVYFFSYMQRVAVPGTIFDELQSEFSASASAVAGLSVVLLYVYGAVQFVSGVWTDRLGAFRVLLTGGCVLCAGALLFPLSNGITALYASRVLIAFGASLVYASIVKSLDKLFAARLFPIVLGISISIGYAGGLTGTMPFAVAVDRWGWRPTMIGIAALTAACLVVAALFARRVSALRAGTGSSSGFAPIKTVIRNRHSIVVLTAASLNFSVYFLFQATLGKKMLHDIYHLPSTVAASFTGIMMVVTITCLCTSGLISRLIGYRRKPVILFSSCCMLAGAVLMLLCIRYTLNYRLMLASYCLLGIVSLGSIMNNALLKELNPPEVVGTAIGLGNGACYLMMGIYTTVTAGIMDRFATNAVVMDGVVKYPTEAYLTITVVSLVMLVVAFAATCFIRETRGVPVYSTSGSTSASR